MAKSKKIRRLEKRAKMGSPAAMYALGMKYECAYGVDEDPWEAAYWMAGAAELGNEDAKAWIDDQAFDDDPLTQAYS